MGVIAFDAVQVNRKSDNALWITLLGKSLLGRTAALMVLECTPETARLLKAELVRAMD